MKTLAKIQFIHPYMYMYIPLTVEVSSVPVSDVDIISEYMVVTSEVTSEVPSKAEVVVSVSRRKNLFLIVCRFFLVVAGSITHSALFEG